MAKMTPLKAREIYTDLRRFEIFALIVGGSSAMILLASIYYKNESWERWAWVGMNVGVWLSIVFLIWIDRLGLFCPHCDKSISVYARWRCGHCDSENPKFVFLSPFIGRCSHCERAPRAYICHHCALPIFLDNGNVASNPATGILGECEEKPKPTAVDAAAQRRQEHAENKEQLQQEIEIAHLTKTLKQIKLSREFQEAKSAQEKLNEKFSEHDAEMMGIYMLEKKENEYISTLDSYPDLQEMKRLSLKAFKENHT